MCGSLIATLTNILAGTGWHPPLLLSLLITLLSPLGLLFRRFFLFSPPDLSTQYRSSGTNVYIPQGLIEL